MFSVYEWSMCFSMKTREMAHPSECIGCQLLHLLVIQVHEQPI